MVVENGHFYGNFNPFIKKHPSKTSKKKQIFRNLFIQTNQPSSTLSEAEALINHQSPIINHQPSIINHQSSIINKQPTATLPLLPLINILRSSFLQKK
jgi:hypothetical protein